MSNKRVSWDVKGNTFAEGGHAKTVAEAWTVAGKRAADHLVNVMDSVAINVDGDIVSATKGSLAKTIAAKVKASK